MSRFEWSDLKSAELRRTRGLGFEDILVVIQNGGILDVVRHPNSARYPGQRMIILTIDGYVWVIPYVKAKGVRFLKTLIPSRRATKEYLR